MSSLKHIYALKVINQFLTRIVLGITLFIIVKQTSVFFREEHVLVGIANGNRTFPNLILVAYV